MRKSNLMVNVIQNVSKHTCNTQSLTNLAILYLEERCFSGGEGIHMHSIHINGDLDF